MLSAHLWTLLFVPPSYSVFLTFLTHLFPCLFLAANLIHTLSKAVDQCKITVLAYSIFYLSPIFSLLSIPLKVLLSEAKEGCPCLVPHWGPFVLFQYCSDNHLLLLLLLYFPLLGMSFSSHLSFSFPLPFPASFFHCLLSSQTYWAHTLWLLCAMSVWQVTVGTDFTQTRCQRGKVLSLLADVWGISVPRQAISYGQTQSTDIISCMQLLWSFGNP